MTAVHADHGAFHLKTAEVSMPARSAGRKNSKIVTDKISTDKIVTDKIVTDNPNQQNRYCSRLLQQANPRDAGCNVDWGSALLRVICQPDNRCTLQQSRPCRQLGVCASCRAWTCGSERRRTQKSPAYSLISHSARTPCAIVVHLAKRRPRTPNTPSPNWRA